MLSSDPEQVARWAATRDRIATADSASRASMLHERSQVMRRQVLGMIDAAGGGHIGGDFSVADILTTLFNGVLRIDPGTPGWPERDRFILSKGHCSAALYATLSSCGYFSPAELDTFMAPLSALNGHPNRNEVPGVETNTGPLGHGLPVGVGQAIGTRMLGYPSRVFVVVGDGEMQEGSNWEALMAASQFELDNLVVIIDRNGLQQGDATESTNALEPLGERLAAFGAEVREVSGHDHLALIEALAPSTTGRPVTVIAHTIKGKGISFMENRVEWHHKVPSAEQVELALKELA